MKKKKVALYPFTADTLPLVLYLERLNPSYHISFVIAPTGTSLAGKDIAWADNRPSIGICVTRNIDDVIKEVDTLLIASGVLEEELHSRTLSIIEMAIYLGKSIICTLPLPDDLISRFSRQANEQNVTFHYAAKGDSISDVLNVEVPLALYEPICPVLMVGALEEKANSFEVFLATVNEFRKKDYCVTAVGCPPYCELLSIHSMPNFNGLSNDFKVKYMNSYIHSLLRKEKPDILIIQMPGNMLRFNSILTNGFGIDSYIISQAIQADYFICCTLYQAYGKAFAESTSHTFAERFGFAIDAFHMSNMLVDLSDSYLDKRIIYTHIPSEKVSEYLQQIKMIGDISNDIPAFNILDDVSKSDYLNYILNKVKG